MREGLPEAATRHKTYLEGREELFETKVLSIQEQEGGKRLMVFSRDPGSASALIPVMKELMGDSLSISAVVDGRAEEAMRKAFPESTEATPRASAFALDEYVGRPDVILIDPSASERGLETNAASLFPSIPTVLIEDFYGTANGYLDRIRDMQKTMPEVSAPARICVMDEAARRIIAERHPELAASIVVTGQPAFDRFATEDTPAIRERVRSELGLTTDDLLLSFMGIPNQLSDITRLAPQVKAAGGALGRRLVFVFRRHPRDNVQSEAYERVLRDAGVDAPEKAYEMEGTSYRIPTDDIGAASDIVLTVSPTSGVEAALRRIPVVYMNDAMERKLSVPTPLPPLSLGAGAGISTVEQLPELLARILEPDSEVTARMKDAMERYYTADGKNAERVADVVRSILPH